MDHGTRGNNQFDQFNASLDMNTLSLSAPGWLSKAIAVISISAFGLIACDGQDAGTAAVAAPTGQYKFEITEDDLVVGNADAPVTIVEYSSMTCPHCATFHETVYPTLKSKYIDTGKVRLVFRPFPLDGYAAQAALLINCSPAKIQMALIDAIFTGQRTWTRDEKGPQEGLVKIAREAQVSREEFAACVADDENQQWLKGHMADATEKYAVTSTPAFYVNGEKVASFRDVAELDRIMAKFTGESASK
jgi:protein-disulfide isomerase